MCINRINICIVCDKCIDRTYPCQDRVKHSGLTTVFRPTPCIDKQIFTYTYHDECAEIITKSGKTFNEYINMVKGDMSRYITGLLRCSDVTVSCSPSGKYVWHPHEFTYPTINKMESD